MLAVKSKAADYTPADARSSESSSTWKQIVGPVEPFLRAVTVFLEEQLGAFEPEIAAYARYALTSQGKQFRPALVALSAGASGNQSDGLVTVAAIIEMVHLATLVHDDVTDHASIRRCRPTLAANWGNTASVLVGDCLFAHALTLAAAFPTPDICRAVAQATKIVCSGEILQTQRRGCTGLDRAEYDRIIRMKTAELFALSCELGAHMGGAQPNQRAALRAYGISLGMAYQIYDDCLDLFGSEHKAGKSLGTDLIGGKLTLPVIVSLERGTPGDRREIECLIAEGDTNRLPRLRVLLDKYDALAESQRVICDHCRVANECLSVLKPGPERDSLMSAAAFIARQAFALGESA